MKEGGLEVTVSGSTLSAGRDLIVTGRNDRAVLAWVRRHGPRRILGASAGVALLVFLVAHLWPAPPATPIDLELKSKVLRFRLAEAQPALGLMSVRTLSALDLEEVRLAGEKMRREPGTRRLDFTLEGLESADRQGTLTLQQGFLPAGSVVELKVEDEGALALSVSSLEAPFSFSAFGDFRFRRLPSGRKAPPWSETTAETARLLELVPRSNSLNLVLGLERQVGQELASSIRIDRLWLHELHRTTDGSRTRIEETYSIRFGKLLLGNPGTEIQLGHGTKLRLDGLAGQISALRWGENDFQFRFQGTATSLSRGSRAEAVELISHRSFARTLVADVAASLTVLNGLLSLILSLPTFLRLLRARLQARRKASTLDI